MHGMVEILFFERLLYLMLKRMHEKYMDLQNKSKQTKIHNTTKQAKF